MMDANIENGDRNASGNWFRHHGVLSTGQTRQVQTGAEGECRGERHKLPPRDEGPGNHAIVDIAHGVSPVRDGA